MSTIKVRGYRVECHKMTKEHVAHRFYYAGLTTWQYGSDEGVRYITNPQNALTSIIRIDYANYPVSYVYANGIIMNRTILPNGMSYCEQNRNFVSPTGSLIASYTTTYDTVFNKSTISEITNQGGVATSLTTFGYDASNQLTNEHRTDSSGGGNSYYTTFVYDSMGNRTQEIDQTRGVTTSNYDIANQLLLTTTFLSAPITHTYDNNGNLLTQISSAGITTYTWDQENRLTSYIGEGAAVPTTYTYSDEGHRQTTITGSDVTQYVWDEDIVLLEIDNTEGTRTQYTQGPGEWGMLVSQQVNTTLTYLGSDDRNNVRLLLPQAGIGTSAGYKAFGSILPTPGTPATPFQYGGNVGYYAESPTAGVDDTEFYRTLHRIYRFHSGRFPQPDPTGINGGYNLYGYAGNNPISWIDPAGTAPGSNPVSNAWDTLARGAQQAEKTYERIDEPLGDWTDKYLLGGAISNWGTVQGQYDSGKASGWKLTRTAASATVQTVLLATSVVDGAVFVRAGAKTFIGLGKLVLEDGKLTAPIAADLTKLFPGDVGVTLRSGRIMYDPDLIRATGESVEQTIRHELVHRFFTAGGSGLLGGIRRQAGRSAVLNSHLLMLLEESMAEGYAKKNLWSGVVGTLTGGYEVRVVPKLVRVAGGVFKRRYIGEALNKWVAGKELVYYVYNTTIAARAANIAARNKK